MNGKKSISMQYPNEKYTLRLIDEAVKRLYSNPPPSRIESYWLPAIQATHFPPRPGDEPEEPNHTQVG